MTGQTSLRKGWCPGALRPMESGDGLLLRIRPHLGTLSIPALSAVARAAKAFGSGEIDLTNRGNLQLRGLSAASHSDALAALRDAVLIDEDAGAESVRNIIIDPLSGIDPARADIRPLARQLEDALARERAFWRLPGKFGFGFSGTADPRIGNRSTDIMVSSFGRETFVVSIGGSDHLGALLPSNLIVEATLRLAAVFLELRASDPAMGRMKDAVQRSSSATIFAAAGLRPTVLARIEGTPEAPPVGSLQQDGRIFAAGVGLPFGRINARQLESLSAVAAECAMESARMSPQRAIVFPVAHGDQAHTLFNEATRCGLITAPDDVRLHFDVCPGCPACVNATTDTRRDAQRIADAILRQSLRPSVHVSGCAKGCAGRGAADLTLVARDGRYDLIRDDDPAGPVAVAGVSPADLGSTVERFIVEHSR